MLELFIIWWLLGLVGELLHCYFGKGKITMYDLIKAPFEALWGVFGFVYSITQILDANASKLRSITIIKRK